MAGEGDDEEVVTGTESEDTPGQDPGAGDEDAEVSAEHADDQADDGEPEVAAEGAEPAEKPSRAQARFQRLANEAKTAKEEAAAARREIDDLRRERYAQQSQQTEAQQRDMLALMTPEERMSWTLKQMENRQAQERHQDRMHIASIVDKTAYDAKATVDPVYAKYKDEVESRFQEQARKGQPVEREIILKLVLGERALAGAGNTKQRKAASARVQSQKVSPGSGKGNVPSDRGKAGDTAESRLKGMII